MRLREVARESARYCSCEECVDRSAYTAWASSLVTDTAFRNGGSRFFFLLVERDGGGRLSRNGFRANESPRRRMKAEKAVDSLHAITSLHMFAQSIRRTPRRVLFRRSARPRYRILNLDGQKRRL